MQNYQEGINIPPEEEVLSWGMSHSAKVPVFNPTSKEDLIDLFKFSQKNNKKIVFRGGGCSYGDASIKQDGFILDMSLYNKIVDWNQINGTIKVQSGVTIKQLWEFIIEKGFWPPVVSGTMFPTIGGALSMNIHGKNNFKMGTLGEHVIEFSFLIPSGEVFICSKTNNPELFYSAISGMGMLGCFLEITLKMKKIYSGKLEVTPILTKNLKDMQDYFDKNEATSDYLVGWVDAFATGKNLGRGLIHKADYIGEGKDQNAKESLKLINQNLPTRFFGIIPKSWMWIMMIPFSNKLGMRLINYVKFFTGKIFKKKYLQGHAEFAFLLDYVPNWKFIYKPGSMIQYQVFLPKEVAVDCMNQIFEICQKKKIIPYLAVFKKHKKDNFLLSHSVDGFSMAMDFPVTKNNRKNVWDLAYELDDIVINAKGKFYFAKDSTLRPKVSEQIFSKEVIEKFKSLKEKYDPNNILESDLYKRVFLS
jgi:decaprenylphospho-beta-D-ribofuranose 2-oxidase